MLFELLTKNHAESLWNYAKIKYKAIYCSKFVWTTLNWTEDAVDERNPAPPKSVGKPRKTYILTYFLVFLGIFGQILRFLVKITWNNYPDCPFVDAPYRLAEVDEGTFDVFVQRGDNPPGKVGQLPHVLGKSLSDNNLWYLNSVEGQGQ